MQIYGKNSVFERLKINPQSINQVYLNETLEEPEIISLIQKNKIAHKFMKRNQFFNLDRKRNTQGIIAESVNFIFADFDTLLSQTELEKPVFLMLDSITDPQNIGSIMRTAACLGNFAIVLPKNRAIDITETVLHIATGAENYIPIAKVTNITQAIESAKDAGYFITGAVVMDGTGIFETELTFPLCLVIGSEGKGIRQGLLTHIDFLVTIPMTGAGLTLNTAQAASIFCYEITRQQQKVK